MFKRKFVWRSLLHQGMLLGDDTISEIQLIQIKIFTELKKVVSTLESGAQTASTFWKQFQSPMEACA